MMFVLMTHSEYVTACKETDADIFVIGGDWGDKPHNLAVEKYLKSKGKKIVQVNYSPKTSSSQIKLDVLAQFHKVTARTSKNVEFIDIEE
ncbi:MAG: hypothetical protein Q9M40_11540 [Sulfurimonas sp.]|nr:hypothetical protein [Sulfurimonas sp.]